MSKKWKKTAVQIVNEIDDKFNIEWDTDANIQILTSFIESTASQSAFKRHVLKIAKEESSHSEDCSVFTQGCCDCDGADNGMRKCRECGAEYNCDQNSFCPGCGKSYETHGEKI